MFWQQWFIFLLLLLPVVIETGPLPARMKRKNKQMRQISNIIEDSLPRHCVYVLECHSPKQVSEIEEPKGDSDLIRVGQALTHDRLFYVGYSNRDRIEERLYKHNRGNASGAKFTQQYEPVGVEEIRWYDSAEKARRMESEVADEYRCSIDSVYVYHRHNRHEEFRWDS